MRIIRIAGLIAWLSASVAYAQNTRTYVGVVTDTMCKTSHKPMNVSPDEKCVRECVGDAKTYKYALAVDTSVYVLSDQETPARFAGRKVAVTGTLYTKTNIIKVDTITAVK